MTDFILSGPVTGAETPESAVVFFHGFGANGQDLAGLSSVLTPMFPKTAFYFPDAPDTVPGMPFFNARQWFALDDFMRDVAVGKDLNAIYAGMLPDALKAAETTRRFVAEVRKKHGLPAFKTVVAGFSQGGLMALLTALTDKERCAGVVGLSACGLAFEKNVFEPENVLSKPPVVLIHGTADPVVPFDTVSFNRKNLQACGIDADVFAADGMEHGIDARALQKLTETLGKFF